MANEPLERPEAQSNRRSRGRFPMSGVQNLLQEAE